MPPTGSGATYHHTGPAGDVVLVTPDGNRRVVTLDAAGNPTCETEYAPNGDVGEVTYGSDSPVYSVTLPDDADEPVTETYAPDGSLVYNDNGLIDRYDA